MQHTDKMRAEFEAWFTGKWPANQLYRRDALPESDPHYDEYVNPHVLHAYEGWKASRAALVIDLPERFDKYDSGDWTYWADGVDAAIEAAGVTVRG